LIPVYSYLGTESGQNAAPTSGTQATASTQTNNNNSTSRPANANNEGQSNADRTGPILAPFGMSEYAYKRVTGEVPLRPEELELVR
jgi:hypothetical protein